MSDLPTIGEIVVGFGVFSFGTLAALTAWMLRRSFELLSQLMLDVNSLKEQVKTLFNNDERHEEELRWMGNNNSMSRQRRDVSHNTRNQHQN